MVRQGRQSQRPDCLCSPDPLLQCSSRASASTASQEAAKHKYATVKGDRATASKYYLNLLDSYCGKSDPFAWTVYPIWDHHHYGMAQS
jgi:hypothetical protein